MLNNDSDVFAEPLEKVQRYESLTNGEYLQTSLHINEKGVRVTMSFENKATCMLPTWQFHSPRKEELRNDAARMKNRYQNEVKVLK